MVLSARATSIAVLGKVIHERGRKKERKRDLRSWWAETAVTVIKVNVC